MLKNILKLDGVAELTKTEKRSVKGGLACVGGVCPKPGNYCCYLGDSGEAICRLNGTSCPG
ncbi:hypothetical protein [Flavobacterium sp. MMS24-S5]|uniref:hypothetical protein n=1 Tax=Flavobacterium sp. MMS24-S5 TaxID=3416605 RepID=UPI003D05B50B